MYVVVFPQKYNISRSITSADNVTLVLKNTIAKREPKMLTVHFDCDYHQECYMLCKYEKMKIYPQIYLHAI